MTARWPRSLLLLVSMLGVQGNVLAIEAASPEGAPRPGPAPSTENAPVDPAPSGRDRIAGYKNLLMDELSLLEVLEDLEFSESKGREEKARLEKELKTLKEELLGEQETLLGARARLEAKQSVVRVALRSLLSVRKRRDLAPLFTQDELIRSQKTQRYFSKLLDASRESLQELATLSTLYREAVDERERDVTRFEQMRTQLNGELEGIADAIATRREILRRLETEGAVYRKYHAELAAAEKKLTVRIRKLQEWREKRMGFKQFHGKLRYPMLPSKVVSGFGDRRNARFVAETFRHGMSFEARLLDENKKDANGVRVRAVYWGKVVFVGWIRGYGHTVILDHSDGYHTVYAHLRESMVTEGEIVKLRASLGVLDSARDDDYRLLYFELRKDGETIDPTAWFN